MTGIFPKAKLLRRSLITLLVTASISLSGVETPAQGKSKLPQGLNEGSSLAEIFAWLNKNIVPKVRIDLKTYDTETYGDPKENYYLVFQQFIFSQGFQIDSVDGCKLTLSNQNPRIIDSYLAEFNRMPKGSGEPELHLKAVRITIPLDLMSRKKGKGPHQYKYQQSELLGTWRTSFREKGFFMHQIFQIELTSVEEPRNKARAGYDRLAFIFDSKESAEQFDATLRHAIKICSSRSH